MKCYVNTYYEFNNYGTKLQNYALVRTLEKYNNEVETIYLINYKKNIKKAIKRLFCLLPVVSNKQRKWKNEFRKEKFFRKFNLKLNYKKVTYKKLKKINFEDSIAICGSDQIWSPSHLENNKEDINLFFMKYIEKERRYSYAPSFGVSIIPDKLKKMYAKNISDIFKVSVREGTGKKIIKDLTNIEATIVPDPVFLLSKEEWSKVNNFEITRKERYIFIYFLGAIDEKVMKKINEFSNENNLKIINIAGNSFEKNKVIISPDMFVKYIENSTYVISDSFHAAAFSIIMEKPFQIFERFDVDQSSRLEDLINTFKCKDNFIKREFIENNSFEINPYYNNDSKNILIEEKNTGLSYIKGIFDKEIKK